MWADLGQLAVSVSNFSGNTAAAGAAGISMNLASGSIFNSFFIKNKVTTMLLACLAITRYLMLTSTFTAPCSLAHA